MCNVYYLTPKQARRFLLLKHGLLGAKKFSGKTGVLDFIKQAGCIQFDPIDICGKNAELTLQSRVKGFSKSMLYELLYQDRKLVDYPDKNLSIFAVEDWPYFARYREAAKESGKQFAGMETLKAYVKDYIEENGPVSSDTLPVNGQLYWHSAIHWSGNWHGQTSAARAVLEQLYSTGELVIHHREGVRKFYDLSFRHIRQMPTPSTLPRPQYFPLRSLFRLDLHFPLSQCFSQIPKSVRCAAFPCRIDLVYREGCHLPSINHMASYFLSLS